MTEQDRPPPKSNQSRETLLQLTCTGCGFIVFVVSPEVAHSLGWRSLSLATKSGFCAACVIDGMTNGEPADGAPSRSSEGRAAHE